MRQFCFYWHVHNVRVITVKAVPLPASWRPNYSKIEVIVKRETKKRLPNKKIRKKGCPSVVGKKMVKKDKGPVISLKNTFSFESESLIQTMQLVCKKLLRLQIHFLFHHFSEGLTLCA